MNVSDLSGGSGSMACVAFAFNIARWHKLMSCVDSGMRNDQLAVANPATGYMFYQHRN